MDHFKTYCTGILLLFVYNLYAQRITIDLNKSYQTIGHWENGSFLPNGLEEFVIDDLVDLTVDSLGINRLRLEVRSGSENDSNYYQLYQDSLIEYDTWRSMRYATVNDNDDPGSIDWSGFHFTELDEKIERILIPLRNRLLQNNSELYINLCVVAFTKQLNGGSGGQIIQQNPQEYAEFIEAIFLHMESDYGIVPDGVEVILEPDVAKFGNGTLMGQCLVATGNRLKKLGYSPDFIACSNTNLLNAIGNMYTQFIAVPGISEYWSEYSFHAYAGRTDDNLIQISDNAKANGVQTSMLEWWSNGHTYEYLHKCLKLANISSYEFKGSFGSVGNDWSSGLLQIVDNGNNNYLLDLQPPVKYFRHYFKFIQPGAVRCHATTDSANFDPIVFFNNDGKLLLNINASTSGNIQINGLPAGTYQIIYSLGDGKKEPSEYWKKLPIDSIETGEVLTVEIPKEGIFSVVQLSSFAVSVDTINPVITSTHKDQTIDTDTNCEAVLPDYTNGVTASDNNDPVLDITQSPESGTTISGPKNTVALTVSDNAGNIAEVAFNVAVEDNLEPVLSCIGNQNIYANESFFYTVNGNEFDPIESSDNCEIKNIVNDFNNNTTLSGAKIPPGTTTITWEITDNSGNIKTCSFDVIVDTNVGHVKMMDIGFSFQPNPTKGIIKFNFSGGKIQKLTISDITGKQIIKKTNIEQNEQFDLSDLKQGIYILCVQKETEVILTKILKQ